VSAQLLPTKVPRQSSRRSSASAVTAVVRKRASAGEAYRLSRIQAEGWNAAHRIAASTLDRLDETQIELLNPYVSDPERTRWSAGFTSALS
jgi:hypothetical protein